MRRRAPLAVLVALALPAATAREQTFPLQAAAGKDLAQHIDVPLDRTGEMVVDATWSGGRSLRLWIEDEEGRSLARFGGESPGRVRLVVDESLADPDRPVRVRIRTIGRRGFVDGLLTVRYPSLADGPEPTRGGAAAAAGPGAASASPPAAGRVAGRAPAGPSPPASRFEGAPDAGTHWPRHLSRLADRFDGAAETATLRALAGEVGRIARAYADMGPALPPPDDPEGEPDEAEIERALALEDLGREVSAMMRLADESGLREEDAAGVRRLLGNVSELMRRREAGGGRALGVDEALAALVAALEEVVGASDAPEAATPP